MAKIADKSGLVVGEGSGADVRSVPAPAIQAPKSDATPLAGEPVSTKRFIDKPIQFYAITTSGELHRVDQPGGIEITGKTSFFGLTKWTIKGDYQPTPPQGFDNSSNWVIVVCRRTDGILNQLGNLVRSVLSLEPSNPNYSVLNCKQLNGIEIKPDDRIIVARISATPGSAGMDYSSYRFQVSDTGHMIRPSQETVRGDIESQIFKYLYDYNLPVRTQSVLPT